MKNLKRVPIYLLSNRFCFAALLFSISCCFCDRSKPGEERPVISIKAEPTKKKTRKSTSKKSQDRDPWQWNDVQWYHDRNFGGGSQNESFEVQQNLDIVRKPLERNSSYSPLDSQTLSTFCNMLLPSGESSFFFHALRTGYLPLIEAFIDQGAVVNDMSVHRGQVRSTLSFTREFNDTAAIALLKSRGATDTAWYELLVPGYWPDIVDLYPGDLLWNAICAEGDSVYVQKGRLEPRYFTVQQEEYWGNRRNRVLFFIATNKPGGISHVKSCLTRPRLLKPGDTLLVELSPEQRYELSVPNVCVPVLQVKTGDRRQLLGNYSFLKEDTAWAKLSIIWAGDIDGDNGLDLMVSVSSIVQSCNFCLLSLSSFATGKLLMGWADEVYVYKSYEEYMHEKTNADVYSQAKQFFPYFKMRKSFSVSESMVPGGKPNHYGSKVETVKFNDALLSKFQHLFVDDSLETDSAYIPTVALEIDPGKLKKITFNREPLLSIRTMQIGETEEEVYTLSAPLIKALLERTDLPEFKAAVKSIGRFAGFDSSFQSMLREYYSARTFLLKYPTILKVLKNERYSLRQTGSSGNAPTVPLYYLKRASQTLFEKIDSCGTTLVFWAERELDSTAELMDTLIMRTAKLLEFSLTANDEEQVVSQSKDPLPMYFEPQSFIDPNHAAYSLLDCRDMLIESYLNEVEAAMHEESVTVNDPGLLEELEKKSGFFDPSFTYYALISSNKKKHSWIPVAIRPELTFFGQEACTPMELSVIMKIFDDNTPHTLLYAALPTDHSIKKGRTPSGYYPLKETSKRSTALEPSDESPDFLRTIRSFAVPECEKTIRNLILTETYRHYRSKEDSLRSSSVLSAVMSSGDTVVVTRNTAAGHHVLYNAWIGTPVMTDANGDGLYDIIVDTRNGSRLLLLQLEYGGFESRLLRADDGSDGAGC